MNRTKLQQRKEKTLWGPDPLVQPPGSWAVNMTGAELLLPLWSKAGADVG